MEENYELENEKEIGNKKSKTNKILLCITILLLIISIGLGTFIFINKDTLFSKQSEVEKDRTDDDKEENNVSNTKDNLSLNLDKSLNTENTYFIAGDSSDVGIRVDVKKDSKGVDIFYNGALINKSYSFQWFTADAWTSIGEKNFDKNITQVLIASIGQAAGDEAILYLMEDGTVEYTPVYKELTSDRWGQGQKDQLFNSYGKLPGVEGVVSLIQANVYTGNIGGYITALAKKADGTFYDLQPILSNTGNF